MAKDNIMDITSSLSDALSGANDYIQQLRAGTDQIIDINKQAAGVEASSALLNQQIGQNAVIINNAQQDAELTLQAAKAKAGEIYGIDLSKNSAIQQQLADVLNTARTQQAAVLQDIAAKKSVSMSDNPVQWLINQFTVNDDIQKHNALDAVADQASARINELNDKGRALAITQEQFKTPITLASKEALNKNLLNQATIKANDSWVRGLAYNANAVDAALKVPKEIVALQFQTSTAQLAAAHYEVAKQHLDLQREIETRKAASQDADDSVILQAANAGKAVRLGDKTDFQYTAKDIPMLRAGINSKTPNQFSTDFSTGMEFLSTGTARLATSPGEAYNLMASGVRMNLPGSMDPVKDIIGQAGKEVTDPKINPAFNRNDVQGTKAQISQRANELLTAATKEIIPGTNNPFEIRSLPALIQSSPTVQALPITQKLFVPLIQAGVDLSSPDKVFAQIVAGMKSGKISYQEAIEATTIFGVGVKANLEDRQFTKLGFDMPKDGSWFSYKTKVQTDPYSMFGRNEIIDWTKPDSLGQALMKQRSAEFKRLNGLGLQGGPIIPIKDTWTAPEGPTKNPLVDAAKAAGNFKAGTIYYPPPDQYNDIYNSGNKP